MEYVVFETGSNRSGYCYSVMSIQDYANETCQHIFCGTYRNRAAALKAASKLEVENNGPCLYGTLLKPIFY